MVGRGWGNSRNGGSNPPSLSVPTSLLAIMHFGVFLVPFLIFMSIILKSVPRILALQLLLCSFPLHKICENTGFQWHILPYKYKIYDFVLIRENTGQWKPVFQHILCSFLLWNIMRSEVKKFFLNHLRKRVKSLESVSFFPS